MAAAKRRDGRGDGFKAGAMGREEVKLAMKGSEEEKGEEDQQSRAGW